MIHFNGMYNLRLTVNSWVSGLRYDVRAVNGQLNNLLPYPPTHPSFFH